MASPSPDARRRGTGGVLDDSRAHAPPLVHHPTPSSSSVFATPVAHRAPEPAIAIVAKPSTLRTETLTLANDPNPRSQTLTARPLHVHRQTPKHSPMIYAVTTQLASNAFLGNVKLPGCRPARRSSRTRRAPATRRRTAASARRRRWAAPACPATSASTRSASPTSTSPSTAPPTSSAPRTTSLVAPPRRQLKHGRLAMLAARASDGPGEASRARLRRRLTRELVAETGGLSPSVLNGHLEQAPVAASVLAFAAMVSAVELQGLRIKEATPVNEWRVFTTAPRASPSRAPSSSSRSRRARSGMPHRDERSSRTSCRRRSPASRPPTRSPSSSPRSVSACARPALRPRARKP